MEAMLTAKLSTHNLAFPMLDFGKTEAGGAMPPDVKPDANRTQTGRKAGHQAKRQTAV
ncbi:hypothetical protein PBS_03270 [Paraburkholderia sp. 2C]|jgi:hypothetical protein